MAWVVWFTGLPGCGKTTIVERVKAKLEEMGIQPKVLEMDEVRKVVTPHPTYSEEERDIVYASLAYMAKLLAECGTDVIVDATANRRRYRDLARELVPQFAEVYVKVPLEVCMAREAARKAIYSPKGIYQKAGEKEATVPGVNVSYEEPLEPEIVVDAEKINPDQNAEVIVNRIIDLFEEA
jgi:adenylylsulfate kinase